VVGACDAVVHAGAYIPANMEDPGEARTCLEVNALGTLHLARLACEGPGRRFVNLSGSNAYRDAPDPVSESASMYPVERASYYLGSKLLGEIYVEHLRRVEGLQSINLRISSPYGPGQSSDTMVGRFMSRASRGETIEVWDGGTPTYDLVYDLDVVGVVLQSLRRGRPGVYNVGSGKKVSIREVACAVADCYSDMGVEIETRESEGRTPSSFPALDIGRASSEWSFAPRALEAGLLDYRRRLEEGSE
jgi:UDP-glucose 4-epimerase